MSLTLECSWSINVYAAGVTSSHWTAAAGAHNGAMLRFWSFKNTEETQMTKNGKLGHI